MNANNRSESIVSSINEWDQERENVAEHHRLALEVDRALAKAIAQEVKKELIDHLGM